MNVTIDSRVLERYPELVIGVLVIQGLENEGSSDKILPLLRAEEGKVRAALNLATYRDHSNLAAVAAVHRDFGNNPNKYPPSIQALVKRVLKGAELPDINPLVNLYNGISLRYLVCVGAEDLDTIEGDLQLTYADGTEPFTPAGETENDPPEQGELVYKDGAGIVCRKLNWREADRTKITSETTNAIVVIEGFPPVDHATVEQALGELSDLLQTHCHAETTHHLLTSHTPTLQV